MKIALVQPNFDNAYSNQRQAYGSEKRPPETGLAVLSKWVESYATQKHEIIVLNPDKSIPSLAKEAAEYDLLGLTDWFSNHGNCTSLAREVKAHNPQIKTVFGGQNASLMPELLLKNHPYIDYVVCRDGEDALLALVEKKSTEETPNLWYRDGNGGLRFSWQQYTDLRQMPIWGFSYFQGLEERMFEYLDAQRQGLDPWLVPQLALFSSRGCIKSMKEGPCIFCASSEEKGRALSSEGLWMQILQLNQAYGAEVFYMADDIFPISPGRIKSIKEAKPSDARAKIRAYHYLPYAAELTPGELENMAFNLGEIGVFNLFFGIESYDPTVLAGANKHGVTIEETERVIRTIHDAGGIKTTVAFLLGLSKESKESLEANLKALEQLLNLDGFIERLYISVGIPFKGGPWCKNLEQIQEVTEEYKKATGKDLARDDYPDYALLSKLSIKHTTTVSPSEIMVYLDKMVELARDKMPDYRIGGFMLDLA